MNSFNFLCVFLLVKFATLHPASGKTYPEPNTLLRVQTYLKDAYKPLNCKCYVENPATMPPGTCDPSKSDPVNTKTLCMFIKNTIMDPPTNTFDSTSTTTTPTTTPSTISTSKTTTPSTISTSETTTTPTTTPSTISTSETITPPTTTPSTTSTSKTTTPSTISTSETTTTPTNTPSTTSTSKTIAPPTTTPSNISTSKTTTPSTISTSKTTTPSTISTSEATISSTISTNNLTTDTTTIPAMNLTTILTTIDSAEPNAESYTEETDYTKNTASDQKLVADNNGKTSSSKLWWAAIGCFCLGVIITIIVKMIYNKYKKKSYVLPPEQNSV